MAVTFSIIVVTLNSGTKLNQTLDSILAQSYAQYEILVKDGGSTDGSIHGSESLPPMRADARIRLIEKPDRGIYDAMNQAAEYVTGDLVLYLNCGDILCDEKVLERTAAFVQQTGSLAQRTDSYAQQTADLGTAGAVHSDCVFYGDTYGSRNKVKIAAPGHIDGFACYRNIPCHQSCFYAAALIREKPYDLQYRIRADYDHFLWCFYRRKARMHYLGFAVADYEGGGFSERKENRKRDREEHRRITQTYIPGPELFRYRLIMALSLAGLRSRLADSSRFSGIYHKLKSAIYGRRG